MLWKFTSHLRNVITMFKCQQLLHMSSFIIHAVRCWSCQFFSCTKNTGYSVFHRGECWSPFILCLFPQNFTGHRPCNGLAVDWIGSYTVRTVIVWCISFYYLYLQTPHSNGLYFYRTIFGEYFSYGWGWCCIGTSRHILVSEVSSPVLHAHLSRC